MKSSALSARALAVEFGKSQPAVLKWIKSGKWPFGKGPWARDLLPDIRAWVATLQPNRAAGEVDPLEVPSPSDSKTERQAKLKILFERGRGLELDNKKKEGALVDRAEVQQRETAQAMIVMNELLTIRALAMKLEGVNLQQREDVLEKWAREVARKFETVAA